MKAKKSPERHAATSFVLTLLCFHASFTKAKATDIIRAEEYTIQEKACPSETEIGLFVCSPGECISLEHRCNGVSECLNGQDESVQECGCLWNEFECSNICIPIIKRCDTHKDCLDGADEINCENYVCPSTHTKCDNHLCVPKDALCDYKNDCDYEKDGDNTDEAECSYRSCWKTEFECDSGQCIPSHYVCDSISDCFDESDEKNCELEHHVTCQDGSLVHRHQWCDGWPECPVNHADEINCGQCMEDSQYTCNNSRCISQSHVCDHVCDCAGLECEDENNCDNICNATEGILCYYGTRCISGEYICDGNNDCLDWVDEYGCVEEGTACRDDHFSCNDGRCIPIVAQCNYIRECLDGSDELDCNFPKCHSEEYTCENGQCIPKSKLCDSVMDCLDFSDEKNCESHTCTENTKQCDNGQCVPSTKYCDYVVDCLDGSDETDVCVHRTCTEDELRCSNSECVNATRRCYKDEDDEKMGCKDGSHLLDCMDFSCPNGTVKCRHSGYCVAESLVCNGRFDCGTGWTDEEGCPYICNNWCVCLDTMMSCENLGLAEFPADKEPGTNKWKLGGNYLYQSLDLESFEKLDRLVYLDLKNNSISSKQLNKGVFRSLWRLSFLNLQENNITVIENDTFIGLSNLDSLYLLDNNITEIRPNALNSLSSLKTLDLQKQRIKNLPLNSFTGLRSVTLLNLSYNKIETIENGAFNGMTNLVTLDLSGNKIVNIESKVFNGLQSLQTLYVPEHRYCCLAKTATDCYPKADEFSSCEDLMSNYVLRVSIWTLGFLALIGNTAVLLLRTRNKSVPMNKVHSFLIMNLAAGDLCMGIYLIIIAVADLNYRGVYFVYEYNWRHSSWCKLAGFLSTFSSELSVLSLTVITMDRLVCIVFPFRLKRLDIKGARYAMAIIWGVTIFLAALPLFEIPYFGNFYGRAGVCLALHITHDKPSGWEYSVFIFLVINFVAFLFMFVAYVIMFVEAKKTQRAVRTREHKTGEKMARRITLIVVTDFCCWAPIILLGVASLGGADVPSQVYAWIAVFVLPLNSAVNPILYTFTTPVIKRLRGKTVRKSSTSSTFRSLRSVNSVERKSSTKERGSISSYLSEKFGGRSAKKPECYKLTSKVSSPPALERLPEVDQEHDENGGHLP